MGLFACTHCGSVDNTAFTNYAVRQWDNDPPLCSACDPDIGKWHDLFPRRHWTVEDDIINREDVTVTTTEQSVVEDWPFQSLTPGGPVRVSNQPLPPPGQLGPGQVWAWIHDVVWDGTGEEPPGHWEIRGTGALIEPEDQESDTAFARRMRREGRRLDE